MPHEYEFRLEMVAAIYEQVLKTGNENTIKYMRELMEFYVNGIN